MSTCPPEMPTNTIEGILAKYTVARLGEDGRTLLAGDQLRDELIAREDNIAVIFYLAGEQYGLFPQIVAEVLAQAGLGNPITVEQRALIHENWHTLMNRLQEEHNEGEQP